jgi:AbrB family looped-hinge helix DNA binding protein
MGVCHVSEMLLATEKSVVTFTVYVRREGRVTVPKELRDAYDIDEGDLVECQIKKIR